MATMPAVVTKANPALNLTSFPDGSITAATYTMTPISIKVPEIQVAGFVEWNIAEDWKTGSVFVKFWEYC